MNGRWRRAEGEIEYDSSKRQKENAKNSVRRYEKKVKGQRNFSRVSLKFENVQLLLSKTGTMNPHRKYFSNFQNAFVQYKVQTLQWC